MVGPLEIKKPDRKLPEIRMVTAFSPVIAEVENQKARKRRADRHVAEQVAIAMPDPATDEAMRLQAALQDYMKKYTGGSK